MSDQDPLATATTTTTTIPITHLFPFTSSLEGPVNSKQYFQFARTTSLEHKHKSIDTYETNLMGRRMIGYSVELPKNVNGHIWQYVQTPNPDQLDDETEEPEPRLIKKSTEHISQFILWKKDKAPNDQDARIKAIEDWHNITDAVHEPIPL
ncbi:ribonuclease H2, subunit C [Phascolomyces articulosus]|uniref:Ribonuclease H2, subunit C n=1 Tax=Phascolomyces articulosus TaxID=60185 RepID=A0AAD5KNZ1_9FUNG|nr:ribonuclease H2, subunit C [Phascolomyces articulosus]